MATSLDADELPSRFEEEKLSQADEELRRRAERARRVGLFRYELIQEVIDPQLSTRQRGKLVRELAQRSHQGPFGEPVRVSRQTIDRWIRWWRRGGFEALVPTPARVSARTPAEVLEIAVALKREKPDRTSAQIARIMRTQSGWAPSERTLQRHFDRLELDREIAEAPRGSLAGSKPSVVTNCGPAMSCTGPSSRSENVPIRLHRR
jgi:hypothetical protein